jgi:hypothetical protein
MELKLQSLPLCNFSPVILEGAFGNLFGECSIKYNLKRYGTVPKLLLKLA